MKTRDFLVGLTFFGLLAVLAALTIFLADFSFGPRYEKHVPFSDVGGLAKGAEVRIDGLAVGRVRGMERRPGKEGIFVTLVFEEKQALSDRAQYAITSASALGGRVVDIWSEPDPERPLNRKVKGKDYWLGPGPNAMDAISNFVRENEVGVKDAIEQIRAFAKELNKKDEEKRTLAMKIQDTVGNLDDITKRLKDGEGLLGRLTRNDDGGLTADVEAVARDFKAFSEALARKEGILWKLADDGDLARKVEGAVDDLEELTWGMRLGEGVVGMLLTDEALRGDVKEAVVALKSVSKKLAGGKTVLEGVLGDDAKALTQALVSLGAAARRIEMATANLEQKNNIIGMLLTDSEAAKEVRNSIRSLSDFIETTRENAPITTFAGILLSPF